MELIAYVFYIVLFLLLLIAWIKARNYIEALEEYIKLQDKEIHLLEFKAKLQDCLLKAYRDEEENRKCSCDVK